MVLLVMQRKCQRSLKLDLVRLLRIRLIKLEFNTNYTVEYQQGTSNLQLYHNAGLPQ